MCARVDTPQCMHVRVCVRVNVCVRVLGNHHLLTSRFERLMFYGKKDIFDREYIHITQFIKVLS